MIETERLRLEPLRREHAELCFAPLSAPELYEHVPHEPPASLEALVEHFAFLELGASPTGTEHWLTWVAFERGGDEPVGTFQAIVRPGVETEIAYQVFARYQGQGHARELVARLLEHVGEAHDVTRFSALTAERNRASIALLERLGFTRETRFENGDVRYVLVRDC